MAPRAKADKAGGEAKTPSKPAKKAGKTSSRKEKLEKIYLINAGSAESRDAWMAAVVNNSKLSSSAILGQGGSTPGVGPGIDGRAEEMNEEPEGSEVHNVAPSAGSDDSKLTLADFELLKVIGRGTYGKVMQVRRKDNGEIFAMKVLKKESIFARNDPKDLQHTIAERNVLALVNTAEHPFILGLKFAFHTPAKLYYVLNYCNGGDLYYLLSRCKRFKEGQVCMRARARACAREPRGERAEGKWPRRFAVCPRCRTTRSKSRTARSPPSSPCP